MDMKPFSNCKIAVCLSGQSRTYSYCAESIRDFFSSRTDNKFYFFGHTTNKNYYKKTLSSYDRDNIETLQIDELKKGLSEKLNFTNLLVEEEILRSIQFGTQLYSQMKSNFIKQQYEVENNMMFDLVVRARFDVCYPHNYKFEDYINFLIEEKTLYSHYGIMRREFVLPNPNQILNFGSSLTMDLVDSFYNVLTTGTFKKYMGHNHFNPAWNRVSDGAMLHKWCTLKNILPKEHIIPFAIIRKHSTSLDYKTEWDKIKNAGWFL